MNRIRVNVSALLTLVTLLIPSEAKGADPNAAQPLCFTILHTNDLHSHDDPYLYQGKSVGGMSRFAHLIRSVRKKDPDLVTVDAGDIFEGSSYFTYYHGAVEVEMLNRELYDIATIGNHEFDDGSLNLAKQLEKAKYSIISCNLDASACPSLSALIRPSIIKTIKGQQVGFIGAIVPNLEQICLTLEGVKVKDATGDWMAPIKNEISKLKEQGVNKIVLVTHVGVELDKKLAELPDVDIIVGGHSHTRLEQPISVRHSDGSSCLVVQTGCYARALGRLDLCFTADGRVDPEKTNYKLIDITDRIHSDADISRYLKLMSKPFSALSKEVVAVSSGEFDNHFHRLRADSALGDLLADAIADGGAPYGATIGIQQRGGIRSHLERGLVTERQVQEIFPFDNTLIVATIGGAALRKILETGVSGSSVQSVVLGGKFLEVHGLKFEWNPALEPMHRVGKVWVVDKSGQLEALDPNREYRIAVNNYSFDGGEGFDYSSATNVVNTGERLSKVLHNYLLKCKNIAPAEPSRIVPVLPGT